MDNYDIYCESCELRKRTGEPMHGYTITRSGTIEPETEATLSLKRHFPSTMSFIVTADGELDFGFMVANTDVGEGPHVYMHAGMKRIDSNSAAYHAIGEHELPVLLVSIHMKPAKGSDRPIKYNIHGIQYMEQSNGQEHEQG